MSIEVKSLTGGLVITLASAAAPPTVDDPNNDKILQNFDTVESGNKYVGKHQNTVRNWRNTNKEIKSAIVLFPDQSTKRLHAHLID